MFVSEGFTGGINGGGGLHPLDSFEPVVTLRESSIGALVSPGGQVSSSVSAWPLQSRDSTVLIGTLPPLFK